MNFVESMATSCGLKSGSPYIEQSFFPIVAEKYITFSSENHQSKQWDHFQEYIDLLNPILKKNNIRIVEIGSNDLQFQNVIGLKGATNANHWAYIIKKSTLHFGPENFLSHLSSFFDIPRVLLFSNTTPEYSSPNWAKNTQNQHIIQSTLNGEKPSFSAQEQIKTINTIPAEQCAAKTLDLLNIKHSFNQYDIFNIGPSYHQKLIEIIPDFVPDQNFFPRSLINIRLDYHFNEDNLIHFANNRKISIVSDKKMDINKLSRIKPAISHLYLKVDENFDEDYVETLKLNGFNLSLILDKSANLAQTRLRFFDFEVAEESKKKKKDLDNVEKICDTTRYKSSKQIFSKEGQFSSKSSYDKKTKTHDDQLIIDEDSFWEDSEYFKLYNLK
jgi:hypothetical protein